MSEPLESRRSRAWLGAAAALLVVGANVAWVSAEMGFLHPPERVLETDHFRYIEMSRGANAAWRGLAYEPPFCYRVLSPLLASGLSELGLSLDAAWWTLTHASLALFLFALYQLLGTYELRVSERLVGVALVGLLQGAVRWYSYQYWMTDPLALLVVTLGIYCVRSERLGALLALSLVSVAVRETYVLVFAYLFVFTCQRRGWATALERTLGVALAPLVLMLLIRSRVEALAQPDLLRLLRFFSVWRFERLFDNQLYFCTVGSFGALFSLLLVDPRRTAAFYREHLAELCVVGMVYASLLIANNTDRLLAYGVAGVVPPALINLRTMASRIRVPYAAAAAGVLGVQALFWQQTLFHGTQVALSVTQPANALVTVAMLALWSVGFVALLRSTPGELTSSA